MNAGRAFTLAWRVGGRLPEPVLRAAAALGADVAWLRRGAGVRQLERNLARVRPGASARELRRLSRAGMRSYLRYYRETFALRSYSPAQIAARARMVGAEPLHAEIAAGRTVLMALGHTGNWDLAGAYATVHLGPVTTVAERLEPEEVFQDFLALRQSMGITIIALDAGGGQVFRSLLTVARGGPALLPLLADRDLTTHGIEVDLFGSRARVAAGPAALAVATGAMLVPTMVYYERLRGARRRAAGSPWGVVLDFGAPLAVPTDDRPRHEKITAVTQAWVDAVAAGIDAHPQDWHMLQKIFIADLDPERYAATVAAQGPQR
ncbi:phosphatidylinositol mannoside acyltransferase [Pengzhenrongella sicca]|uniref:Phosphatidylinositol mannoside acyltransferase n=1 Tax=Pengzhenrongella sicca TaxID=2819238 RepID=A0A8A4ZEC2_9MICO|nr:phosphatidylinositol mannoside acyltransferase [Pengzhenrongella sicca]QTE28048.1 phosphatidylinositol mannoside acyltransferase [Pengzhenrongella sicca]